MNPISGINGLGSSPLTQVGDIQSRMPIAPVKLDRSAPAESFGKILDGLVSTAITKENTAESLTQSVLLGESTSLHQSVIASTEADVAFTLMVEVRNKLLESYQELTRMQL